MRTHPIHLLVLAVGCTDGDPSSAGAGGAVDGNVLVWEGDGGPSNPDAVGLPDGGGPDAGVPDGGLDAGEDAGVSLCEQSPTQTVTASVAASDVGLRGTIVAVIDALTVGPLACSDAACPPDDPCCQSCGADIRLGEGLALAPSECRPAPLACSGDNCVTTCSPPLFPGQSVRVVGRIAEGDPSTNHLEVFSVSQ